MSARNTALGALIACRKTNAWSDGVLKEYIRRDRLDSRDAALATRLCYGVLAQRKEMQNTLLTNTTDDGIMDMLSRGGAIGSSSGS